MPHLKEIFSASQMLLQIEEAKNLRNPTVLPIPAEKASKTFDVPMVKCQASSKFLNKYPPTFHIEYYAAYQDQLQGAHQKDLFHLKLEAF